MSLPFGAFECDRCGACCRSVIVEAGYYDALREPRLYSIGRPDPGLLRSGEACIMLYDTTTRACPFLGVSSQGQGATECRIHATRPLVCVMVEPGDAKCQQSRLIQDLPMLRDRDGRLPSRRALADSCLEYSMDLDELLHTATAQDQADVSE